MIEWIVTSSLLILIICLLRLVFQGRISARLQYGLWALVLVRLLLPFTIPTQSSIMEVVPSVEELNTPIIYVAYDSAALPDLAIPEPDLSLPPDEQQAQYEQALTQYNAQMDAAKSETGIAITPGMILIAVWIFGMLAMSVVILFGNLRFYRKLRRTRTLISREGIAVFSCPDLQTSCLYGLFCPAVYLTKELSQEHRHYVLTHELTHYRHWDHIWSFLRTLCLIIHWYNPLVWLAAILSKRDAELSCDEATVKQLGEAARLDYGKSLIAMTCIKRSVAALFTTATTMTGAKHTLKHRIIFIAKHPRTRTVTLVCVILALTIAAGCGFAGSSETPAGSDPTQTENNPYNSQANLITEKEITLQMLSCLPYVQTGKFSGGSKQDYAAIVYIDDHTNFYSSAQAYLAISMDGQISTLPLGLVVEDSVACIRLSDLTGDGLDEILLSVFGASYLCHVYTVKDGAPTLLCDLDADPEDIRFSTPDRRKVRFAIPNGQAVELDLSDLFTPDDFNASGILIEQSAPNYACMWSLPVVRDGLLECSREISLSYKKVCTLQYTLQYDAGSEKLMPVSITHIPPTNDQSSAELYSPLFSGNEAIYQATNMFARDRLIQLNSFFTDPGYTTTYIKTHKDDFQTEYYDFYSSEDIASMTNEEILESFCVLVVDCAQTFMDTPIKTVMVCVVIKDPQTGRWSAGSMSFLPL